MHPCNTSFWAAEVERAQAHGHQGLHNKILSQFFKTIEGTKGIEKSVCDRFFPPLGHQITRHDAETYY